MINRIAFFESVDGIQYPSMIVDFFDHFIALKKIVEDSGKIKVLSSVNNQNIIFSIEFATTDNMRLALNVIESNNGIIDIYGRPMNIAIKPLNKKEIQISIA